MAKRAVLVGCNYRGTSSELHGCANDVRKMRRCLIDLYEFSAEDIDILIDIDDLFVQPTAVNIKRALTKLVSSAEPGDCLFFQFSGHGSRVPAETDESDNTGFDECVIGCDFNVVTDDEFRMIVDMVPEGCRITIISDSCHSGGLIDETKEQVGHSTRLNDEDYQKQPEEIDDQSSDLPTGVKSRSLSVQSLMRNLEERYGKSGDSVRLTLLDIFGDDVSSKVKQFAKIMTKKLQGEDISGSGSGSESGSDSEGEGEGEGGGGEGEGEGEGEVYDVCYKGLSDKGILISGCQTNQYSVDISNPDDPEEANGALTREILAVLEETNGDISNKELVLMVRERLEANGYGQQPGLYCSDEFADARFIC